MRLEAQDQGVNRVGSPGCVDSHLLLTSSHSLPSVCLCPNLLFLFRQSPIGLMPTLINHLLQLNYLLKSPVSKYSCILRSALGLVLQNLTVVGSQAGSMQLSPNLRERF